ncbi:hypothetical protein E2C01_038401 [Portunus trituberculatus]|uniref:Uncharacterized protein n=1 Tax=Portunus trituberculatus TaxID=210409 RepID=A0A5B7FAQ7_PORTR|nr:hypothetical protein [Portunus trituberculatus]
MWAAPRVAVSRYAEPAAAGATRRRPRRGTPAADISPPGIRTDVAKTLSVPESGGGRGGRRLPLHSDPALSTCLRASAEIRGSEMRQVGDGVRVNELRGARVREASRWWMLRIGRWGWGKGEDLTHRRLGFGVGSETTWSVSPRRQGADGLLLFLPLIHVSRPTLFLHSGVSVSVLNLFHFPLLFLHLQGMNDSP